MTNVRLYHWMMREAGVRENDPDSCVSTLPELLLTAIALLPWGKLFRGTCWLILAGIVLSVISASIYYAQ